MKKESPAPTNASQPPPFVGDMTIKSSWVDSFNIAVREDGVVMIRGFASLPEGHFEQMRFLTTRKNMEELVDILCGVMQYTPRPPAQQKIETPLDK